MMEPSKIPSTIPTMIFLVSLLCSIPGLAPYFCTFGIYIKLVCQKSKLNILVNGDA
jgi:hypothetical protein